jgi:hypothetical protein
MADKQITPEFIESMVDRIIHELSDKLEQLDISMDYVAAALLDDHTAQDISNLQRNRGRMSERKRRKQ